MAVSQAIGVLGGSFNPPHLGHLAIASEAMTQLDLEQVVFVPAAAPPHKDIADDVPAAVRLEMTRLAVEGDRRFEVSPVEIDLGLRFTSDTLAELHRRHAGRALAFIAGSDALLQFETWHEPATILELALLVVAPRPGDDAARDRAGGGALGSGQGRRAAQRGDRCLVEHDPRTGSRRPADSLPGAPVGRALHRRTPTLLPVKRS